MERRAESRFQVASKIRVIVPDEPARVLECDLGDISATGMRIFAPEPVKAEAIVAVEVDLRLILVEVRHCEPRGMRYVVGVRRLHEIDKYTQMTDPVAVVREMIADLRGHISSRDQAEPDALATRALADILERDGVPAVGAGPEIWEPEYLEPEAAVPDTVIPDIIEAVPEAEPVAETHVEPVEEVREEIHAEPAAEVVPAAETHVEPVEEVREEIHAEPVAEVVAVAETHVEPLEEVREEIHAVEPEPVAAGPESETPEQQVEDLEALDAELLQAFRAAEVAKEPMPAPVIDPLESIRSSAADQEPIPVSEPAPEVEPEPEPVPAAVAKPANVDLLDAFRTAEANKAASAPAPAKKQSWTVPIGIAAGILIASAVMYPMIKARMAQNPPPVAAVAPAPVPEVVHLHHAQIKMTQRGWVSIVSDSGQPYRATLSKGDIKEVDFLRTAKLSMGAPNAVEIRVDGNATAPVLGGAKILELTPQGVKAASPN